MNEENNRDPGTEEPEVVNKEANCVSREVKKALKRMKKDKAVGPDKLPVEVWKCMKKMGIEFLTRLFNRLLMGEQMPEEWRRRRREEEHTCCLSQIYKKGMHSVVKTTEE